MIAPLKTKEGKPIVKGKELIPYGFTHIHPYINYLLQ